MTDRSTKAGLPVKLGLGLTALAGIAFEVSLTRLFSATAGYHFAFMIVSLAMFGMTAGALYAFVRPPGDARALHRALAGNASAAAISLPISYAIQGYVNDFMSTIGPLAWIAIVFVLYAVPFFFAGVCVSLCLSRFSDVGKLYAYDLMGAAIGCPLIIVGLTFADPQALIAICAVSLAAASFLFMRGGREREVSPFNNVSVLAAIMLSIGVLFLPPHMTSMEAMFGDVEYVKWSPVGRVIASKYNGPPVTWSLVKSQKAPAAVPQKGLFIDFGAFTVMTGGSASDAALAPIKSDITAIGNRLRPGRSLFVIGVGGGRDVLTGLLFGQKHIDGVEVNPAIISMLKKKYGEFNGHIAERPGVTIVNDEARNWLARSRNKYGVIQCSLVDTWSASSSGAFMLVENVLYTREAFESYIRHLDDDGVLCFLRWGDRKQSGQILRMLYLAKNALVSIGVKPEELGDHVVLLLADYARGPEHKMGAMLVSPKPFSQSDLDSVAEMAAKEGFDLLWLPGRVRVEPFATAITTGETDAGMPTDDRPFFFTPVNPKSTETVVGEPAQGRGLALLFFTFLLASVLVVIVILFPLLSLVKGKTGGLLSQLKSGWFFSMLGIAFMLIEVAQVQRLTLLLGNPTYGLSVVLFALLLSAGAGSYAAQYILGSGGKAAGAGQEEVESAENLAFNKMLLGSGLVAGAALILLSVWLFGSFAETLAVASLAERMAWAIPIVAVPGFFMGWGFPLGMVYFSKTHPEAGAWFWSVNGAMSVLSSVLAAIISVIWGIHATLAVGAVSYLLALLALL